MTRRQHGQALRTFCDGSEEWSVKIDGGCMSEWCRHEVRNSMVLSTRVVEVTVRWWADRALISHTVRGKVMFEAFRYDGHEVIMFDVQLRTVWYDHNLAWLLRLRDVTRVCRSDAAL
jgi:hypothetical protein